jgi:hypothetical protein
MFPISKTKNVTIGLPQDTRNYFLVMVKNPQLWEKSSLMVLAALLKMKKKKRRKNSRKT